MCGFIPALIIMKEPCILFISYIILCTKKALENPLGLQYHNSLSRGSAVEQVLYANPSMIWSADEAGISCLVMSEARENLTACSEPTLHEYSDMQRKAQWFE